MKLHIFNPEHDLALAANQWNWTSPKAGRIQRQKLFFLPERWAAPDDLILMPPGAVVPAEHRHDVRFVSEVPAGYTPATLQLEPWGWDRAVVHEYHRLLSHDNKGLVRQWDEAMEPRLDAIRALSSRCWCVRHLQTAAIATESLEDVAAFLGSHGSGVLKSPWSSSGRGVLLLSTELMASTPWQQWARGVIARQGCVVVEPLYNKVKDFALEFFADEDGSVRYEGLSLFHTEGATYRGNVIASEKEKRRQLSAFIPWEEVLPLIDHFRKVMSPAVRNIYTGPFGIDLMVVDEEGHYYVKVAEMNLRKTMGWAAIKKVAAM
ncbi:hypothetical protein [Prevotella sp. AGR2160]|uniref:hypothetical protein n=1 Tax=Prevotella sp. AGR2160 TaxID=1280674 RepID=UPI00040F1AED|nr:hypothetical protein [Prevotella sp. AGR2160]